MAITRDIRTNQVDVSCDVCGRTLLRGEQAEPFLAGGARRLVCELCSSRAAQEGWIREAGADDLGVRHAGHERRGRSLMGRLRTRRERSVVAPPEELAPALAAELEAGEHPVVRDRSPEPPPPPPPAEPDYARSRESRHVQAVPTNADMKRQRALDLFNASDHPRTVGGVARSLGAPAVSVRPTPDRPAVVMITVMWELSWYRYEVDLSDEAGGVLRADRGDELSDLSHEEHETVNAAADERGRLELAADAR